MTTETGAYSIHPQAAFREIEGEVFIVTPDNHFHNLSDPVAAAIWRACDERPRTMDELVVLITERFDVTEQTAREDLEAFLRDGMSKDLLVRR